MGMTPSLGRFADEIAPWTIVKVEQRTDVCAGLPSAAAATTARAIAAATAAAAVGIRALRSLGTRRGVALDLTHRR